MSASQIIPVWSGQDWLRKRGTTVYLFRRHAESPDLWQGVKWATNAATGSTYIASRPRTGR